MKRSIFHGNKAKANISSSILLLMVTPKYWCSQTCLKKDNNLSRGEKLMKNLKTVISFSQRLSKLSLFLLVCRSFVIPNSRKERNSHLSILKISNSLILKLWVNGRYNSRLVMSSLIITSTISPYFL